jgi:hypothetical protein
MGGSSTLRVSRVSRVPLLARVLGFPRDVALASALAFGCVDAPPTSPVGPGNAPLVGLAIETDPSRILVAASGATAQRVIYDTDMNTDVDDVGASLPNR